MVPGTTLSEDGQGAAEPRTDGASVVNAFRLHIGISSTIPSIQNRVILRTQSYGDTSALEAIRPEDDDTVLTPVSWVSRFSGCRYQALCLMTTATAATTMIATMAAAT